jgi:hypothetical protein
LLNHINKLEYINTEKLLDYRSIEEEEEEEDEEEED